MPEKSNRYKPFFSALFGLDRLYEEKARLEAFLAAVPGEYCGWSADGSVVYSDGFCRALGLAGVESIHDIQAALSPGDSAALEGMFIRLQEDGRSFSLEVRPKGQRGQGDQSRDRQAKGSVFRLSGSRGAALDGRDRFDILWLEDISAAQGEKARLEEERSVTARESERLQAALDVLPVAVWMRKEDAALIWSNDSYARIFKVPAAEVVAEQKELPVTAARKAGTEDKPAPGRDLARKALDRGCAQHTETHVIIDGQRRKMRVVEMPLPGSHRTLGMAMDLTHEEDLENKMNRYLTANKELLEQLGTAIGLYGSDTDLEFHNTAFAQLWGLDEQWLNTRPKLGEVMEKLRERRRLPEQADFRSFKQSWLDMFTKLIEPHEDMLYLPDGTALRFLVIPHPMGGLMMTFENVTSRLELESSYNTLIAVQKETLDNLAEGIAVYGGDGRLKLWNPAFAALWHLHPEDLDSEPHITALADKMAGLFAPEDWPQMRDSLISQSLGREGKEGRIARNDGTLLTYRAVPLPDGGLLASYFDVTDSARVENALREKNVALETAERLKLDFLANVSYQLRTPLNAIMGFAELLGHDYYGKLNARQSGFAGSILEAGARLTGLVDDILDLSTLEAGYLELEPAPFSVYDMLQSLAALMQDWARKQKIDLVIKAPKNIGKMTADERRIKQVLLNLIHNALENTPEGGKITLSGRRLKDGIVLSVSDTGRGIPESQRARIFEPFERVQGGELASGTGSGAGSDSGSDLGPASTSASVSASATAERGAGLGLTLVKNIVALHGGEVTLESEEDKGTTVTLLFPPQSALDKAA